MHGQLKTTVAPECVSLLQGVAALMAMNSMEIETGLKEMGWGSAEHLHAAIESMRLGFVDTLQYNADPQVRPCFFLRLSGGTAQMQRVGFAFQGNCTPMQMLAQCAGLRTKAHQAEGMLREIYMMMLYMPLLCRGISLDGGLSCTGGACADRRPAQQGICKEKKGRAV